FVTGGTFDKVCDEIQGRLFFRETHVGEMQTLGRTRVDVSVQTLMMADRLEVTGADRQLTFGHCRRAAAWRIVIAHGTDTMVGAGRARAEASIEKTIVLAGAMVPYAFGSSDGLFNLGSALSFAQGLSPGVYIAMNGTAVDWHRVRKNRQTGYFETT